MINNKVKYDLQELFHFLFIIRHLLFILNIFMFISIFPLNILLDFKQ